MTQNNIHFFFKEQLDSSGLKSVFWYSVRQHQLQQMFLFLLRNANSVYLNPQDLHSTTSILAKAFLIYFEVWHRSFFPELLQLDFSGWLRAQSVIHMSAPSHSALL